MAREKEKKKKKGGAGEFLRRTIFILALIVFIGSAGYLIRYYMQNMMAERTFGNLKTEQGHDLAALHAQNPDCVGWIQIPDTKIDYPVMWTPGDPEYYLRRDFNKEYQVAGTPFIDGASDMATSKNIVIYGHNMKAGTMFSNLTKYEDPGFYEAHKTVYFETLNEGLMEYEVVAVFPSKIYTEADDVFKYYQYPLIESEGAYNEYVAGIKNLSTVDTGITPTYPEQLITLSTCEYSQSDGRYVLVARKVPCQNPTPAEAAE